MEAIAVEVEEVEATIAEEAIEPAARTSARAMFKYSEYIHFGENIDECPTTVACISDEESRECEDAEHFHVWCRLPNHYQHQDIRQKALAAKARKIRELRDPESDVSVILDHELSQINDPIFVETIIDELIVREFTDDYLEAQRDVEDREEYEHIAQDREEYERLRQTQEPLSEEEQSEEFKRLGKYLSEYIAAIRERLQEIQDPKKEHLRNRPIDEIAELVRTKRIDEVADQTFIDTYNVWMWFVGTYKVQLHPTLRRPHLPMWERIGNPDRPEADSMLGESSEVLGVIRETYQSLQLALQRGSAGN